MSLHSTILTGPQIHFSRSVISLIVNSIRTKFPYNARSDWLTQSTLSENRARVDDIKVAFKFLLPNFDKFDQN